MKLIIKKNVAVAFFVCFFSAALIMFNFIGMKAVIVLLSPHNRSLRPWPICCLSHKIQEQRRSTLSLLRYYEEKQRDLLLSTSALSGGKFSEEMEKSLTLI